MPRRVTLTFDHDDTLVTRTGSLVESSATTLTVRLEAPLTAAIEAADDAPPAADAPAEQVASAPEPPSGGAPIIAVVHAPGDATGSAFLMTTRLPASGDPAVVRLTRAGRAP